MTLIFFVPHTWHGFFVSKHTCKGARLTYCGLRHFLHGVVEKQTDDLSLLKHTLHLGLRRRKREEEEEEEEEEEGGGGGGEEEEEVEKKPCECSENP